jgi:hypothetical protein
MAAVLFTSALSLMAARDPNDLPKLSPEKIASLQARFGGVTQWELRFSFAGDNPHAWHDSGTEHRRTQWFESSQGAFHVPGQSSGGGRVRVMGRGPCFDTLSIALDTSAPGLQTTRYDRGAGMATVHVDFDLDLTTGTYDASFVHDAFTATYGGSETNAFETRTYGPSEQETHVAAPHSAPAYVKFRLPEQGTVISGTWSWEELVAAKRRLGESVDEHYPETNQTRGRITWTLQPADPVEVELVLEAVGDEDWMPEARDDEQTPANDLALRATLLPKAGGELTQRAVEITFSLAEVSRETGVALNFPVGSAATAPDLQFVAARNPGDVVIGAEGRSVTVRGTALEQAEAMVSSFDWGAYGGIEAWARLQNGRVVRARLRETGKMQLQVPRRSSGGFIADAWRARHEFTGADGADSDVQAGNPQLGDGLTAYEEYRGLVIAGRHTRNSDHLDPKRKDLVVLNEIGAAAKAGLALFEAASGIHVVEMRAAELPKSREANPHRASASGGAQHGLLLVEESLQGGVAGVNRPADVLGKTPRLSEAVVVDRAMAQQMYAEQAAVVAAAGMTMPYTAEEDLAQTIAHEIAHGVGAPHHGKTTEYVGQRKVTVRMKDWPVFGVDGLRIQPTEERPIELSGRIGRPGNDASGDLACIMAYPNFYQWAAVGPTAGPHQFYALPPLPVGRSFCTTSAGTGVNARRHKLPNGASAPSFFGNAGGQAEGAPQGNCLGAMKVRDW